MLDHYHAVIMAGGGGTRLWPLSRTNRPKQMLNLIDDRSLFQTAVDRLEGLFTPERIIVVTVADQAAGLQEQCPQIPIDNYLLEPMPRGTASVVGFAAVALKNRDPDATMAILTADHLIQNEDNFRDVLRSAYAVSQENYLVTLGITPSFPSTGYGYIEQGDLIGEYLEMDVYRALRFREKPVEDLARKMIVNGDHSWNSGMFVWRVDSVMAEIARQMPDLDSKLAEISQNWNTPQSQGVIQRVWPTIQPETIDYGIMENAQNVAVIPAKDLGWSDVGSWDALFEVLPADEMGMIAKGGHNIAINSSNSLIYTNQEDRLIVTIGVDDLVIVDTGDVVLVCKKDQAQAVRQVVGQLKQDRNINFI
jgi:mannose-1-phosphate guanylyltransferase